MHMVTILPIPILRITIVREPQLSAGFAGKSRSRGALRHNGTTQRFNYSNDYRYIKK